MPRVPALVLSALVAAAVGLSACAGPTDVAVRPVAATATSTPAGFLAEAGWPGTAAWITEHLDQDGQPVVVKFFASWCLPCKREAPEVEAVATAHPEITFLGVAHEDTRDGAEAFVAETGLRLEGMLLDRMGEVARAMGARAMPAVSFVDADGTVVYTHSGPSDRELLEGWIAYLDGSGPRPAMSTPAVPLPEPS